ncbi:GtrA family protein [Allobranchiibius sp. GilTou38]|uniref:GtrA family protein n=1 Tax=Allobranchiibius sp. GilTou38 TaxID=2815210 RepID=UPI001AA15571|nr:GtrA family protein [Allobranchiibius sp. GilTou38]MBO1767814.1 GtrA family protein [Allobranchiibius sp. GilTou38]
MSTHEATVRPSPAAHNGSGLRQAFRFGVVGIFGFAADVGGFNLLRSEGPGPLHDYPISAKVISSIAGVIVAWLGNRYWTFRHTRRDRMHHEFLLFAVVSIVGIAIAAACLAVSHYLLGYDSQLADNISGNGIGLILATVFRFWAYKHHVFVSRNGEPFTAAYEDEDDEG